MCNEKLSKKEKSFISYMKRKRVVYKEDLNDSQKMIAKRLSDFGIITEEFGSWSGLTCYRVKESGL